MTQFQPRLTVTPDQLHRLHAPETLILPVRDWEDLTAALGLIVAHLQTGIAEAKRQPQPPGTDPLMGIVVDGELVGEVAYFILTKTLDPVRLAELQQTIRAGMIEETFTAHAITVDEDER